MATQTRKTLVGKVDSQVLAFTIGKDPVLDMALTEADCIGSAAHAAMLARLDVGGGPVLSKQELAATIAALREIIATVRSGKFRITAADQDVHLAVERMLSAKLGEVGRRIHTARSRNDQVATDLRLYAKTELLELLNEGAQLAAALLAFAKRYQKVPMVGRTHMQPAMPSSVGVWASAHAESLLDDMALTMSAYDFNDRCPLGSAAGYGVPLPIDRQLTADLLGFAAPQHNVLYAGNARGKCETVILSACVQVMLTLSRLAEDLILFTTPEMPYFTLPADYCTGSSIMPQKQNPDVAELVRAKASRVMGHMTAAMGIVKGLPSGYNRDLQEVKEPFMAGVATTRACLAVMAKLVSGMTADRKALTNAFEAGVFAADRALELVAEGLPFRDAYQQVKESLDALETTSPQAAIARKTHLGASAGLDLAALKERVKAVERFSRDETKQYHKCISALLGANYPEMGD
ncbi:MAG: argininosuccinate lyase [Kiritimatiellae bacterium]|nr:argininosuccinate lyase [Kiritimatiellia bacterium]